MLIIIAISMSSTVIMTLNLYSLSCPDNIPFSLNFLSFSLILDLIQCDLNQVIVSEMMQSRKPILVLETDIDLTLAH